MKQLFTFLIAAMLIGVSCEDSSKDVDSTPKGVVFADGTEMSAEFGSSGGSKSFSFSSDLDWEVTTSADWISVTPSSGTPSVKKFTVKASANDSFEERSGTVTMTTTDDHSYTIEVTQAAEEEIFTINAKGEYEVSAAGGEVKVRVTTNLEYTVEIPAEAKAWLSVADTRAVIREETLTFTVAKNETLDERSATVELKGADGKVLQSIVFKQKEYGGTIEVDEEYVVDAEGGELEVKLSTDIDFTTSIPEEAKSWISIVETRSMRSESVIFNIAINDDVKERSATINLQNAKGNDVASFVIRQKGGDALLELQNQYSISNMGGNFEVAVTTNLEYEVEISADATSWLSYVETRALRTDKLIFNATPNEGEAERSGTIKLIGEDNEELQVITVTQRGNIFEFAYSTNDGKPLDPYTTEGFGGEFVENIYDAATGHGVLKFAGAVSTIPEQAFAICENLTRIDIPEGITTIGASAFTGCSALEEITIPDSVTTIGDDAFYECNSLTSVYVTDITAWCNISFGGYNSNPLYYAKALYLNNELVTDLTIPDSVTSIGNYAFAFCESLTSVTIGDSVTTIGAEAFSHCFCLTSVTIGDSVTTIGEWAFYSCVSLTSVTIGDSVTTIGDRAFRDCRSLTSVYCKATTPPTLGYDVFDYNASGRKIYVPVESVGVYRVAKSWSSYRSYIVGYDFETGEAFVTQIKYTSTTKVETSNPSAFNVAIISNEWDETTGEGVITFNGELTTIGEEAFENCTSLTSVTIGNSVTTIGGYAFDDCDSLTSVTIGDSVMTIGEWAFSNCYSLTSVTIPDSVTTIGENAFSGCRSLTSVYCKATTPPTLKGSSVFDSNQYGRTIYVPDGSLRVYKLAENWSYYAVRIVEYDYNSTVTISYTTSDGMPAKANGLIISNSYQNGVGELTYIGKDIIPAGIFCNCDNLTSVTIPDSVTTIGASAFYDCNALTSVTIPDGVTTIGDYAFYYCDSLTSVTIGDSVTTIGYQVFAYCESLTSVTIPDSVTTIGSCAFHSCTSLTSVTIGNSVTTIGVAAFNGCSSLTSVTIPDSVTTIEYGAFDGCSSLTSVYCKATTPPTLDYVAFSNNADGRKIYVPAESVEAYKAATHWSDYASSIVAYDFDAGAVVG